MTGVLTFTVHVPAALVLALAGMWLTNAARIAILHRKRKATT